LAANRNWQRFCTCGLQVQCLSREGRRKGPSMNTIKKTFIATILAILAASQAAAADVKSDYDRAFDLSKLQSLPFF
jgi:hypothetical protein